MPFGPDRTAPRGGAWGRFGNGSALMQLPLITVDTHGELSILATPDQVSRLLEAQDVRDGEFRLFDSAGVE